MDENQDSPDDPNSKEEGQEHPEAVDKQVGADQPVKHSKSATDAGAERSARSKRTATAAKGSGGESQPTTRDVLVRSAAGRTDSTRDRPHHDFFMLGAGQARNAARREAMLFQQTIRQKVSILSLPVP